MRSISIVINADYPPMTNKLSRDLNTGLAQVFGTQPYRKTQVIQKLWSGYGEIARYSSDPNGHAVIVKVVEPQASAKRSSWLEYSNFT